MNGEIKNCPMCDGYAVVREDRQDPDDFMYPKTYFYVECAYSTCEVRTRSYETQEQAIEGWNRRPEVFDNLPLCPPHKKLEETHGLTLAVGDCLACSLNKAQDAADDLKQLEGSCWACLHVGDPWRHEHEPDGGHWHHFLDPGDGLPSPCSNSDMLERIFSDAGMEVSQ